MKRVSSNLQTAVLVFSKGFGDRNVKTRLSPILNLQERLALHLALLKDAVNKIQEIGCPAYLFLSDSKRLPFEPGIPVRQQVGSDLGNRMLNAFREMLAIHERVIIIGTDSPALSARAIQNAFDELKTNEVVIGPSEDGGYYLIGLSVDVPEIFNEISWGTSEVTRQTMVKLQHRKYRLLDPGYDLDLPADMDRLRKDKILISETAPETKRWLDHFDAKLH
jgi:rSAM/selenodomain-associated transferase 1